MRRLSLLLIASLMAACGGGSGSDADASASADAAPTADANLPDAAPPTTFGGARPTELLVPSSYDSSTPMPLVIVLHGYSSNNTYAAAVTHLADVYDSEGFFMLVPSGTLDSTGNYFWNGTDACCDLAGSGVDDVAYLNGLIDDVSAAYSVDAKRVFIVGHSNGGFMAYRMACASASRVAAIVSIAGASFDDAADCTPAKPVSVLQIHGSADTTILPGGGSTTLANNTMVPYPSAAGSVARWASYDGCGTTTTAGSALDLVGDTATETTTLAYDGCPTGIGVELWSVADAPHLILFKPGLPALWTWLKAHPRP